MFSSLGLWYVSKNVPDVFIDALVDEVHEEWTVAEVLWLFGDHEGMAASLAEDELFYHETVFVGAWACQQGELFIEEIFVSYGLYFDLGDLNFFKIYLDLFFKVIIDFGKWVKFSEFLFNFCLFSIKILQVI